jgi:hypothetical protein
MMARMRKKLTKDHISGILDAYGALTNDKLIVMSGPRFSLRRFGGGSNQLIHVLPANINENASLCSGFAGSGGA